VTRFTFYADRSRLPALVNGRLKISRNGRDRTRVPRIVCSPNRHAALRQYSDHDDPWFQNVLPRQPAPTRWFCGHGDDCQAKPCSAASHSTAAYGQRIGWPVRLRRRPLPASWPRMARGYGFRARHGRHRAFGGLLRPLTVAIAAEYCPAGREKGAWSGCAARHDRWAPK